MQAAIAGKHAIAGEIVLFLEDEPEPVDGNAKLRDKAGRAGVKAHVHRCRTIEVIVHFSQIIDLALQVPELSPRELAVRFTDEKKYFVSEASVYRLLKAHDLITGPAYVVIKAANEFKDQTTAINRLWQTDFTYLKITGWGWYYLSTVLDDFSRFIVAWRLGPTMCASDVTATLDQALAASGLDSATVVHRPRLLSDNGASYVAGDLADLLEDKGMLHVRGAPYHPQTQGKIERWHQTLKNRSYWKTIIYPEISTDRLEPLSSTTIMFDIMRASKTSHLPTFTSAERRRSSQNADALNLPPSRTDACSTDCRPLKL